METPTIMCRITDANGISTWYPARQYQIDAYNAFRKTLLRDGSSMYLHVDISTETPIRIVVSIDKSNIPILTCENGTHYEIVDLSKVYMYDGHGKFLVAPKHVAMIYFGFYINYIKNHGKMNGIDDVYPRYVSDCMSNEGHTSLHVGSGGYIIFTHENLRTETILEEYLCHAI